MKPSVSRVLAAALSLMVASGCSVKEERDACPCRLFLNLQSVDRIDQTPCSLRIISDDGFEYSSVIGGNDFQDPYIIDVPRTGLDVVVCSGAEGYMDEQGISIPLGNECPPVYIHSSRVDAAGETVCDTVCLRKNYCILSGSVDSPDGVDGMVIRGEVDGYDRVGNPRNGEFRIYSQTDVSNWASGKFCVPRQDGRPLFLDVLESDGIIKTFPLHEYISAFGYDWEERDLNDLNMHLNYTAAGVVISIKVWDEEFVIDVVI